MLRACASRFVSSFLVYLVLYILVLVPIYAVSFVSSLALLSSFLSRMIFSLSLFNSLRKVHRSSLGLLRAFITGHYFSRMLLTVTLRNDKLICSLTGRGGKVYHANEGSAHVFIDRESYKMCGKMQSREGSILSG